MYNKLTTFLFDNNHKEGFLAYYISIFFFVISAPISQLHSIVVFSILLFYPIWSASIKKIDYLEYGLLNIKWKRTLYYLTIWTLVTFIPYVVVVLYFKNDSIIHFVKKLSLPKDFLTNALFHIFAVGFSEEFFYRGYMQPLIQKKYNRYIIKAIKLDTGVLIVSLLFGVGHFLTYFTPFSLLTFFPSLVFGILKNQTDNIVASMFYHGFSNALMYLLIYNIGRIYI